MCKKMNDEDKQNIINLKNNFSKEFVEELRDLLHNLDVECEYGHYSKPYHTDIAADDIVKLLWPITCVLSDETITKK